MLDFETPTYVTAKEAQHMQSQVNTKPPVPPQNTGWLNNILFKNILLAD